MRIGGLQKTTLLDFPGKVGAVVFTRGCNFLCPYCHNPDLVFATREPLVPAEVMAFLARRRKVLEGVVVSGGEPTLQDDLPDFCAELKSLGYALKLDTNGSRPKVLQGLLEKGLLDYVAMDVKALPSAYPRSISPQNPGGAVAESMELLRQSGVEHEFRIPCAAPFITPKTFQKILEASGNKAQIFLQTIRLEQVLDPEFFVSEGRALRQDEVERLRRRAERAGRTCFIR